MSVTILLCVVALATAHPMPFYDDEMPSDDYFLPRSAMPNPTVNIYKIYAPKQIFINGLTGKKELEMNEIASAKDILESSDSSDKQMIKAPLSIIDRILNIDDMMPNGINAPESYFHTNFDQSYYPDPSNIVSKKSPVYDVDFTVGYPQPGNFIRYQPNGNVPAKAPPKEQKEKQTPMSALGDFFKEMFDMIDVLADDVDSSENNSGEDVVTTEKTPEEVQTSDDDLDLLILKGAPEDFQTSGDEEDVVEVERNFVKTILPDNTSVVEEIIEKSEEEPSSGISSATSNGSTTIEIDIVDTLLPALNLAIDKKKNSLESSQ